MDVVVRYEHSDVVMLECVDYLHDVFHGNGVDAGEWLVEEHEFGVAGERSGDFGASSLAPGEHIAFAAADMGDVELLE